MVLVLCVSIDGVFLSAEDNSRFASVGGDKVVPWIDVSSGKVIRKFFGHEAAVNAVALNEEATVMVSGAWVGEEERRGACVCERERERSQMIEPTQVRIFLCTCFLYVCVFCPPTTPL
jgi:hypothetical protein